MASDSLNLTLILYSHFFTIIIMINSLVYNKTVHSMHFSSSYYLQVIFS